MNHEFDELAKGLAQSVTRRDALKRFGLGTAGFALALFGPANRAAGDPLKYCLSDADCPDSKVCVLGFCVQEVKLCRSDADCPRQYYCAGGTCHHTHKGGPY
jgi:hypothetical protein